MRSKLQKFVNGAWNENCDYVQNTYDEYCSEPLDIFEYFDIDDPWYVRWSILNYLITEFNLSLPEKK